MWQSIPRTGSLFLRASRPHSFQRFPRCLLSSLHASLPASSGFLLPPLSSLHASLPASSGLPAVPLSPPCLAPCAQRFPAVSPLHASPPASSVSPAASSLLPPCLAPCAQRFPRCPSLPPDPVSPPLKHNKIS